MIAITKNKLNLLIENFLFESDDDEEKQEKERQDFLDAASHKERYGKNLSKHQLAYLKDTGRKANRTLYLNPDTNEQEEERLLRKFKSSDFSESESDAEDDPLLGQSIYDLIFKNVKRIKDLENKYQMLSGNFKVIDGNSKDNRRYIETLGKEIGDLAMLYNPEKTK
tara:strand:- start:226 stop:726 length:501 start_codon:yes stop_codon:yes gene_type:complete